MFPFRLPLLRLSRAPHVALPSLHLPSNARTASTRSAAVGGKPTKAATPSPASAKLAASAVAAQWELVVGAEIHAQIEAATKLFSSSPTPFGAAPNSQVSIIDAAMPGSLPVRAGRRGLHGPVCCGLSGLSGLGLSSTMLISATIVSLLFLIRAGLVFRVPLAPADGQ